MKNNKGVTFIIVLGVIAILSGLAMNLFQTQSLLYHKSLSAIGNVQNKWLALSNEIFINNILESHSFEKNKDSEQDFWYNKPIYYKLDDNIYVTTHIRDEGSCLNINALSRGNVNEIEYNMAYNQFLTLMTTLQIDEIKAKQTLEMITDWIDKDNIGKYEIQYGLTLPQPQRPKNKALEFFSELYSIGADDKILDKIAPYSCAWNKKYISRLNFNTVSDPILINAFTMGNVSVGKAKDVIGSRPETGFRTTSQAYEAINMKQDYFKGNLILKSNLYESQSKVNMFGKIFYNTAQHYYSSGKFEIINREISP